MPNSTVDTLVSSATRDVIDLLVGAIVAAETVPTLASAFDGVRVAASETALKRLTTDLYGDRVDDDSHGYAGRVLRFLVSDALAARACQCARVFPQGCGHGTTLPGARFCGEHFTTDTPEIYGARLCRTCYAHVVVTRWA